MEVISSGEGREPGAHALRGELELHSRGRRRRCRKLEWELDAALPSKLTLDFSGVSFMDSSGIAVVMRALKRMRAMGGSAAIKNVPPQAKRCLPPREFSASYRLRRGKSDESKPNAT
ncbi:MAG: STAS domain-containing protein [Oscillibacter sp.]